MEEEGNQPGQTWISWNHITMPKRLGGGALLDVRLHMVARQVGFVSGSMSTRPAMGNYDQGTY